MYTNAYTTLNKPKEMLRLAETYRKSKIEKLIQNLEIKKRVLEESLHYWENQPHLPDKSLIYERIAKIELIDEILIDIRKNFDLT